MNTPYSISPQDNQEIIPGISLDMEHRITLTTRQKELLLIERQNLIDECIHSIQTNFFRIGKALAEIKKFRLYKQDALFPSWRDFVNNRIVPKLHQSTISDYIGIVQMQVKYKDVIQEDDLIRLGYKKSKLLKARLSVIEKEEDPQAKRQLEKTFKTFYERSFKEFRDLPYTTYERALNLRILGQEYPSKPGNNLIIEKINDFFKFKFDKKNKKITIIPVDENHYDKLESFFHMISALNSK